MAWMLPAAIVGAAGLQAFGSGSAASSAAKSQERLAARQYQQYLSYLNRLSSLATPANLLAGQNQLFQGFMSSPAYGGIQNSLFGAANQLRNSTLSRIGGAGGFQTGVGALGSSLPASFYGNALAQALAGIYQQQQDPALALLSARLGPAPPVLGGYTGPSAFGAGTSALGQGLLGGLSDYAMYQALSKAKKP